MYFDDSRFVYRLSGWSLNKSRLVEINEFIVDKELGNSHSDLVVLYGI